MARFSKFLFGGIVGAGLALLLAPKTGRELRNLLMGRERPALPPPAGEQPRPGTRPAADLQARIVETRRQVEAQLAGTTPPPGPVVEAEPEVAPPVVIEEEEVVAMETEAKVETETETAAEAAEEEEEEEGGEFADLKTPASGEPTTAETAETDVEEAGPAETASRPEPSRLDQDEMRRRIDETRARLKAKAFDAMVSGETFIETEEDKRKKPEGAGEPEGSGLGKEVEQQIDESLREEY